MVNSEVSKTSAHKLVGSSPTPGTKLLCPHGGMVDAADLQARAFGAHISSILIA